ncbi:MAG: hypothetical protein V4574_19060 [Pseudomonadota bacterium]
MRAIAMLAAILLAGGSQAIPAAAQAQARGSMELGGRALVMTPAETKALADVRGAIAGRNRAAQDGALAAAHRAAQGPDARHVLALYELEIARQRNDDAMRAQALDVLIASSLTDAATLASYLGVRGGIAFTRGDLATAGTLWGRLLEMKPGDAGVLSNLAQVRVAQNDAAGAADLLGRAVAAHTAAGQPVSEALYRQWMGVALQARQVQPGIAAAHALVRAYPGAGNWRDALNVYRQLAAPKDVLEIDLLRLMRATGSLSTGNEYQRMAQLLGLAGLGIEAKAVLDEGQMRSLLDPFDATTHKVIAEIDRVAAQERSRPAPAPTAVPVRQAMALAFAGRSAEAEALFRSAAAAPGYADIALFWLDWLAQQPKGQPALPSPYPPPAG